jgi:hypothetical protein
MKSKKLWLALLALVTISATAVSELYAETVIVNCSAGNTCCVYGGAPIAGRLDAIIIMP